MLLISLFTMNKIRAVVGTKNKTEEIMKIEKTHTQIAFPLNKMTIRFSPEDSRRIFYIRQSEWQGKSVEAEATRRSGSYANNR